MTTPHHAHRTGGRHAAVRPVRNRPERHRVALVALAALLVAVAIAVVWVLSSDQAFAERASTAEPTTTEVLLRVQTAGGLGASPVPAPPLVTLYADGYLVTADRPSEPTPALPGLTARTLDPAALGRVVAAAEAARLGEAYADPADPDGQATTFTFRRGEQTVISQFAVLGIQESDSPDAADRRAKATALLEQLRSIESITGAEGVSAPEALTLPRLAVSVRPVLGGGDAVVKAWPAPNVDLATLSDAGSCVVVDGDTGAAMRSALTGQIANTHWQEREARWQIFASPLLPDQTGCPTTATG